MGPGLVWGAVAVWGALGLHVSVTDARRAVILRRVVWPAGAAVAALLGAAALTVGEPAPVRLGRCRCCLRRGGAGDPLAAPTRPDRLWRRAPHHRQRPAGGLVGLGLVVVGPDGRRGRAMARSRGRASPSRPRGVRAMGAGLDRGHRRGGGLQAVDRGPSPVALKVSPSAQPHRRSPVAQPRMRAASIPRGDRRPAARAVETFSRVWGVVDLRSPWPSAAMSTGSAYVKEWLGDR